MANYFSKMNAIKKAILLILKEHKEGYTYRELYKKQKRLDNKNSASSFTTFGRCLDDLYTDGLIMKEAKKFVIGDDRSVTRNGLLFLFSEELRNAKDDPFSIEATMATDCSVAILMNRTDISCEINDVLIHRWKEGEINKSVYGKRKTLDFRKNAIVGQLAPYPVPFVICYRDKWLRATVDAYRAIFGEPNRKGLNTKSAKKLIEHMWETVYGGENTERVILMEVIRPNLFKKWAESPEGLSCLKRILNSKNPPKRPILRSLFE